MGTGEVRGGKGKKRVGDVETFALYVRGDPQAERDVDDLEDDQRNDGVIDDHDAEALELVDHLHAVAFEQAGGAAVFADREHAGEDRAGGAADAVHAEAVERVVVAEGVLERGGAEVAADAAGDADHDGDSH